MDESPCPVVIVDDAAEVRLLVRSHLELSGQFVVVAEGSDGLQAIEVARHHQPEIVLLDVSMPLMDGLEALPHLREVAPDSRIVLYTGFDRGGLSARARELGAAGLIEKSLPLDELAGRLAEIRRDPRPGGAARVTGEQPVAATVEDTILDEHLERFREVFEEAAIGMATMTLTGQIVRVNKALAALIGCEPAELVGRPYASLAAGPGVAVASTALEQVVSTGAAPVQFEFELASASGGRWLLATAAAVKDARGRPLYLFVQSQDISVQRRTEEDLRQSEERFRLLVEAVQDYAIFMLDPQGHVASWNAGAERIKGYRADQIIGQHFRVFYPPELQASRHPEWELEMALEHDRYEEEGWRIRRDGTRFWALVVITAVHNPQGHHIGYAKVTRNMDERRQMLLDAQARAADQAEFLAVTAHELRTPVTVLSGSANLLVQHWSEIDEAERADLVSAISTSAERLQRLLGDLLTASRLESRAIELDRQSVDVGELLTRSLATGYATRPEADIRLDCPAPLYVLGEPDRIAQAVENLIANAVRHGAPPVTVAARRAGDRVEIAVSDAGGGVSDDVRDRLFERFATGRQRRGTGLGLFIVRELARAHGGDAWYEPPGEGPAAFVLSLPAADA